VHEIHDKLEGEDHEEAKAKSGKPVSFQSVIIQILLLDIVFSLDSIITAIGMASQLMVRWLYSRQCEDTFPAYYRSNTSRSIRRLARQSGFEVISVKYLGQYPSYFRFNRALFLVAAAYEKLISRYEFLKYLRGWLLAVLRKP
jgi:hypothetical protein